MADDLWEQDYRVLNEMVMALTVNPPLDDDPESEPNIAGDAEVVQKARGDLEEALGMIQVRQSMARLYAASPPYLVDGPPTIHRPGYGRPVAVTERGLRVTGAWPTDRDAGQGGKVW